MPCSVNIDITTLHESVRLDVQDPVCLPQGGGDDESALLARIAGDNISALRVVWENEFGVVKTLDSSDTAHACMLAGLTVTAADANSVIYVQRGGVVDASGLGLDPGCVWAGTNGQLTQTPPTTGLDIFVGMAVAPGRLYLSLNEVIYLGD